MKQDLLDVLRYLFDNYTDEADESVYIIREVTDEEEILALEAEFNFDDAQEFDSRSMVDAPEGELGFFINHDYPQQGLRVYDDMERHTLGLEGIGLLVTLEQLNILNPESREQIIDQAMELDCNTVELEQLKWLILMTLFEKSKEVSIVTWLESMDNEMKQKMH